ncbi:hypothetical protein C8Q80DRAFT_949360 [Daedaleopsis nitida]|nr:hypothetical protein C8Q80DRAFT_949360 [Daedaleopsis nitida]
MARPPTQSTHCARSSRATLRRFVPSRLTREPTSSRPPSMCLILPIRSSVAYEALQAKKRYDPMDVFIVAERVGSERWDKVLECRI